MPEPGYNRSTGIQGEHNAEQFLLDQGFTLISKNFRYGKYGEIDLIVKKGDLIVFVEVKKRTGTVFGGGIYSISRTKKMNLEKTARFFMQKNIDTAKKGVLFRFDLVSVSPSGVEWIKDIIR